MSHLTLLLAQVLPPVKPLAMQLDPARARVLTRTDWAVILVAATPVITLMGSMIRYRRANKAVFKDAQRRRILEPLVWLNTRTGVYHFEGDRWYGRTRRGMLATQRFAQRRGCRARSQIPVKPVHHARQNVDLVGQF